LSRGNSKNNQGVAVEPKISSQKKAQQKLALLNQGMNDNLAPIQKLVWV
jgi:hypothetical protein